MHFVSYGRFLIADYVIYLVVLFSVSRDVALAFSGIASHASIGWQDFYTFRE